MIWKAPFNTKLKEIRRNFPKKTEKSNDNSQSNKYVALSIFETWNSQLQIRNDTTLANLLCDHSCTHWYFVIRLHFRRGWDRRDLWHALCGAEMSENVLWTTDGKTLVFVWRKKQNGPSLYTFIFHVKLDSVGSR
jgi:hypothetical protein